MVGMSGRWSAKGEKQCGGGGKSRQWSSNRREAAWWWTDGGQQSPKGAGGTEEQGEVAGEIDKLIDWCLIFLDPDPRKWILV